MSEWSDWDCCFSELSRYKICLSRTKHLSSSYQNVNFSKHDIHVAEIFFHLQLASIKQHSLTELILFHFFVFPFGQSMIVLFLAFLCRKHYNYKKKKKKNYISAKICKILFVFSNMIMLFYLCILINCTSVPSRCSLIQLPSLFQGWSSRNVFIN